MRFFVFVSLTLIALGGCTTNVIVPPDPIGDGGLTREQLDSLGLPAVIASLFLETAYVEFDADGCPKRVFDLVNHCPQSYPPGLLCRGMSGSSLVDTVRFWSGPTGENFGITFVPAEYPCVQPDTALSNTANNSKTCTIKAQDPGPSIMLKYTVVGTSACADESKRELDPYIIIVK